MNFYDSRSSKWTPYSNPNSEMRIRPRFGEVMRFDWPFLHYAYPHKLMSAAHRAVARAIRKGEMEKSDQCQKCGSFLGVIAHHESYIHPLLVLWLCGECHMSRHRIARYDLDHTSAREPVIGVLLMEMKEPPTHKPRMTELRKAWIVLESETPA
jgi:ribosomal protein S27AE